MIIEVKVMGNLFFGLLGGELFMYKELFDVFEFYLDVYF